MKLLALLLAGIVVTDASASGETQIIYRATPQAIEGIRSSPALTAAISGSTSIGVDGTWNLRITPSGGRGPYSFGTVTGLPGGVTATNDGDSLLLSGTSAGGSWTGIVVSFVDADEVAGSTTFDVSVQEAPASFYAFGSNRGSYANGTTTDARTAVAGGDGRVLTSLTWGFAHLCGIDATGIVNCAGYNEYGELGRSTKGSYPSFVQVSSPAQLTSVLAFQNYTCGLTAAGRAYCWGKNEYGNLGTGNKTDVSTPTAVSNPSGSANPLSFTSLAGYNAHTCGIAGGKAWCWGSGAFKQLGGTSTQSAIPVAEATGATFSSITVGNYHTCALKADGSAWCWGINTNGQLGRTVSSPSATPLQIAGRNFSKIAAGGNHTCGLETTGTMYCWGSNGRGQLGNGTTDDSAFPILVGEGRIFEDFGLGGNHTCGLSSGRIYCWGHGGNGQIGTGSTVDALVPTPESSGRIFRGVRTGTSSTMGLIR